MKCCPACGQTLPPPFHKGLELRGGQRIIFEAVQKAGKYGIEPERIVQVRYGNDPNGGPEDPRGAITSHIVHINKRLKKIGKRICGVPAGGPGSVYILKDIECK